jgi:F5/8 type C domain
LSLPVVTIPSRGLPVVEAAAGRLALPVIEATNGRGLAVTKVSNGLGLPVVYDGPGVVLGALVSPNNMTAPNVPAPYAVSSLSDFGVGFEAFHLFDGAPPIWASGGAPPQWVKIDLGAPVTASAYTIRVRPDAVAHQATAWTLEGSLNNIAWTVTDTRAGQPQVLPGALIGTYAMATPGTYRYWRWTFTASLTDALVDGGELALYA